MKDDEALKKGITLAVNLQKLIVRKASSLLESNLNIQKLKNLYYTSVSSSGLSLGADADLRGASHQVAAAPSSADDVDPPFSRPMVMARLGQYIMDVKLSMAKRDGGWTGKRILPLVLIGEERAGRCLVVGISPLHSVLGRAALDDDEDSRARVAALVNFNLFFRLAASSVARQSEAAGNEALGSFRSDCFDAHVLELPREVSNPFDFVYELSTILNAAAI